MLWFSMFFIFLIVSIYFSYFACEIYFWIALIDIPYAWEYYLKLLMYENALNRLLSFYWLVWWLWFVPRFFWGVSEVQTYNSKVILAYLVAFYATMFFIFYIFWSFIFWLNLNSFVDYSVFSINLFLIFFFNFVYSIFFKATRLESKVLRLLP